MDQFWRMGFFLAGFGLINLAERRHSHINYQQLILAGAEELIPWLMRVFYIAYLLTILLIFGEWTLQNQVSPPEYQIIGMSILMGSLLLRIWTIQALGSYWTMRCLFIPGCPKIETGPFRFLSHPEYVSRWFDIVGVGMFAGASISTLTGLLVISVILKFIISTEKIQLKELSTTWCEVVAAHKASKLDQVRDVE